MASNSNDPRHFRIGILYQEDPIFFGPFLKRVLRLRPSGITILFKAGSRGAGGHPRSFSQKFDYLATLWLILEPLGFLRSLVIRILSILFAWVKPLDCFSVARESRRLGIIVEPCGDPNSPEFRSRLSQYNLDIVLNQTEILLKPPLLAIPSVGFVNRHGSLLPNYRGRLASFWSHAAESPREGVTFHLIDAGLDTGPIILQRELPIDPRWSFARVVREHSFHSSVLFWEAVDCLADPDFKLIVNQHDGTKVFKFPTKEQALEYRRLLGNRRKI